MEQFEQFFALKDFTVKFPSLTLGMIWTIELNKMLGLTAISFRQNDIG